VNERIPSTQVVTRPEGQALLALQKAVDASGLEAPLLELVKIRASQINGCAFCLDMHTRDARAMGERNERLDTLAAWREVPLFSARERAALAWTEAVTLVAATRVPDEVYDQVRGQFSEQEVVSLTFAIVAINGWNRLAVSFRRRPGDPRAARTPPAARAGA
jgi:AhpD family alkylhydroperoxidase